MSAKEGLLATIAFAGGIVGFLTGIEFSADRAQTPWRPMGTFDPSQILKGRRNFEGAARRAYVCYEWLGSFKTDCTDYEATFYPAGPPGIIAACVGTCGSFSATIALKGYRITGMETESEAAVIEELTFDAYHITQL